MSDQTCTKCKIKYVCRKVQLLNFNLNLLMLLLIIEPLYNQVLVSREQARERSEKERNQVIVKRLTGCISVGISAKIIRQKVLSQLGGSRQRVNCKVSSTLSRTIPSEHGRVRADSMSSATNKNAR